jgi:hypothetical protein
MVFPSSRSLCEEREIASKIVQPTVHRRVQWRRQDPQAQLRENRLARADIQWPTLLVSRKAGIFAVDWRSSVEQQLRDFAIAIESRMVESCGTRFVLLIHQVFIPVEDRPDQIQISSLHGIG